MVSKLTPLEIVMQCVSDRQNFLLQGGAGSGKTESLSQVIRSIVALAPDARIVCITHTNKAAAEILSRIGEHHYVGTIHSFLNQLYGKYKKNIHQHIWKLFKVERMHRRPDSAYSDKKSQNLGEHNRFKEIYDRYAAAYFTVKNERLDKVIGKREYDDSPENFNEKLNKEIEKLNTEICDIISGKDHTIINYNETRFNSFDRLTYGHDGLLELAAILFEEYPLLGKIVTDKYDCIFVDEFQDTNPRIVTALLRLPNSKCTVGFFGDSMQSIYSQGIGSVQQFIDDGTLLRIEKDDNYRCSEQVIGFINTLRYDGLIQEVAYKLTNDILETAEDRTGNVTLYMAAYPNKPHARSSPEEKKKYEAALSFMIEKAKFDSTDSKTLLLSNKAISSKGGFSNLYEIFSDRYRDPNAEIENILDRLQLFDLFEICEAFKKRDYNFVLTKLKKSGIVISNISDKKNIAGAIDKISSYRGNAIEAVNTAIEIGLLSRSDTYAEYLNRITSKLNGFLNDAELMKFETEYLNDGHTFTKMSKRISGIDEEYFEEQKQALSQKNFYTALMSEKFSFQEVFEYCKYQDEQTPYVTMHKTKGTGITDVLVVLDEYFWNEYDFSSAFNPDEIDQNKREKNCRLIYVACSRAKRNLRCVRLVSPEEKYLFVEAFRNASIVEVELPST